MTKKQIRILLACTVLLPVWIIIGIAFVIFPGIIAFFMGIFVVIGNLIQLIGSEDRAECWEEIGTGIVMTLGVFLIPFGAAYSYVETGKLLPEDF